MAASRSPARTSLDDDWEEVADDYSVVSLPTSDDEHEGSPIASPRAPPSSKGKSPPTRLDAGETPPKDKASASSDTKPLLPAGSPPSYAETSTRRPLPFPGSRVPYCEPDLTRRDTRNVSIASDNTKQAAIGSEDLHAAGPSTAIRRNPSPTSSDARLPPAPQQVSNLLDRLGTPLRRPQPATQAEKEVPKAPELTPLQRKEKEVLFMRHKLQKGLLSRNQLPKEEEMKEMSDYIAKLEAIPDLEVSIIRATKINKVLKAILRLDSIPKDEEFKFKARSQTLLENWTKTLNGQAAVAPANVSIPLPANGVNATGPALDLQVQVCRTVPSKTTPKTEQVVSDFNKLSVQSGSQDADASVKREGPLGESLDFDESSTDPILIHTALLSLGDAIQKTSQLTVGPRQNQREATEIHCSCQALLAQINELSPLLAEYADHWTKTNSSRRDIPLDPSLMLWMSSLSGVLSEVERKIGLLDVHPENFSDMKRLVSFTNVYTALSDHSRQMDDFMPIMRIDFNDWRTKKISFPSSTTPETSAGPRHNFQPPSQSVDQLPRIRHAMYALKDEIQRAIEVLDNCQSWLPDTASNTATEVLCSLGSVFEAVSLALSNNGSEWIENDLGATQKGLLSHAQFSNLDPSTIEDFTTRIKQISDLVHMDPNESRMWSAHMVRQHHLCMLIEQQQLDALETIASVLKEIMMPNKIKTKTELEDFLKEI